MGDVPSNRKRHGACHVQSGYKTPISTTFAVDLLAEQINKTDHVFWPDHLSLRDNEWIDLIESSGEVRLLTLICWRWR